MRFKKIKVKDHKIYLEYEVQNKTKLDSWDEFMLGCADEPRREFKEALQALVQDVVSICELPEDYASKITVTGCSFSYAGEADTMGCTLIAQMSLRKSNVNLNLVTPHKIEAFYSDDGDPKQLLDEDCVTRLQDLMKEAEKYIDGDRAQGNLFSDSLKEGVKAEFGPVEILPSSEGSDIESVTLSSGGKSVTLTSETRKKATKAIKKMGQNRARA